AEERARKTVAFYVSVGEIYRRFLAENGFSAEVEDIHREYLKSGFKSNHELVTDDMLESLTICGLPNHAREQLAKIHDAGITHPIIQFNPIGNTSESFDLLTSTLSDAN
ncbi:MAG TPA: LLM class flavin-dependent oxidoreductase, partial [Candidatus Nitrosotenuis sp.]|nr:LLM class flavin-dependent oxidoreductase [Candidatus Nitrosotenuis sp.]